MQQQSSLEERRNKRLLEILTPRAAALAPHEEEIVLKKRLLDKIAMVRDATNINQGEILKGDQTKEYCWVNVDEKRQLWYRGLGWQVCRDENVETRVPRRDDGTFIRGDLILYEIDKEYFEILHAKNLLRGMEAVEGSPNFTGFGAREGVRITEKHTIETDR